MTLAAGTRLGSFEVVAPLGAGGMGEVYRARDTRLAREIAVKILPPEVAVDPARLKRFEKEARAASALNHPNIVTIYDIGSEDSVAFIAMERVEGKTLRELLFTGGLPIKKLLQIAAQIAGGLAKAHEAGIVHRDLKPENVMVTKDGLVKILDFGLAKQTGPAGASDEGSPTETGTSPGVVLGTVGYMSPEQAGGHLVDFRSDQFSFGSILYEMATGERAFQKETAVDTLSAILHEEPKPIGESNAQAPVPLRWIVERCLAKEPENRYASTADLVRELATVRDRLSEVSSGASPGTDASRKSFAPRVAAFTLAGLVVLAAGFFAGLPVWKARLPEHPKIRQVTFRRTGILQARFAPDGQIVYSAVVPDNSPSNPGELFVTRPGALESRSLNLPPSDIRSISSSGEMAIILGRPFRPFTLGTVSLAGGAPREVAEGARDAAWSPDGKSLAISRVVDGDRWRLEYPVGKVLYEAAPPGFILKLSFSPKGDRLAFNDQGQLTVIDLAGVRRKIPVGELEDLQWSPNGEEIWTNAMRGGATTIEAVTLSGRKRLLAMFPGDFAFQDVDRSGRILLERITEENEMVFGRSGDSAERNLTWLDKSIPVAISGDGGTVLFAEIGQGGGPGRGVYLRRTDGAPAVRLGDGSAKALSPDGQWVLVKPTSGPDQLVLLPTGAGQPRGLRVPGIRVTDGAFFPDGKRLLLRGAEDGHGVRLYALDLETNELRALAAEGVPSVSQLMLSPDGKQAVSSTGRDGKTLLYDLESGSSRPIKMPEGLYAIQWCSDGRLFVRTHGAHPLKVFRLDISSGRLELWKEISVSDIESGVVGVLPTRDGKAYVYGYRRYFSDLFIAEGLK